MYFIYNYNHIYSFQNSPLKLFNNNKKHPYYYASCITTWQNSSLHTNAAIVLVQVYPRPKFHQRNLNFYCIITQICECGAVMMDDEGVGGVIKHQRASSLQHNKNIKRRMRGAVRTTEPWGAWRLNGLVSERETLFQDKCDDESEP